MLHCSRYLQQQCNALLIPNYQLSIILLESDCTMLGSREDGDMFSNEDECLQDEAIEEIEEDVNQNIETTFFQLSRYSSLLVHEEKLKYCRKLITIGIQECPFVIPAIFWTQSPEDLKALLPPISSWDVTDYLYYHLSKLDGKRIKNIKSLEAYKKFVAGYLRHSSALITNAGICIVRGEVRK